MSLRLKSPMPHLDGATDWLNFDQPDVKELSGSPTLIYFWAVSCDVCHEHIPQLETWRQLYVPRGLRLVSIHAPRQKEDLFEEKVKQVKDEYHITEPLAVDNRHVLLQAFENQFFPAYFLYDAAGTLVRRAAGVNGLSQLAPLVEDLLGKQQGTPFEG